MWSNCQPLRGVTKDWRRKERRENSENQKLRNTTYPLPVFFCCSVVYVTLAKCANKVVKLLPPRQIASMGVSVWLKIRTRQNDATRMWQYYKSSCSTVLHTTLKSSVRNVSRVSSAVRHLRGILTMKITFTASVLLIQTLQCLASDGTVYQHLICLKLLIHVLSSSEAVVSLLCVTEYNVDLRKSVCHFSRIKSCIS